MQAPPSRVSVTVAARKPPSRTTMPGSAATAITAGHHRQGVERLLAATSCRLSNSVRTRAMHLVCGSHAAGLLPAGGELEAHRWRGMRDGRSACKGECLSGQPPRADLPISLVTPIPGDPYNHHQHGGADPPDPDIEIFDRPLDGVNNWYQCKSPRANHTSGCTILRWRWPSAPRRPCRSS